jgi:hypothetical protein
MVAISGALEPLARDLKRNGNHDSSRRPGGNIP